jgi:Tfp pilus assembly protein PilX
MTQFKSRLSSEQGISLIVTLVLMVVLMASGATVLHFSSSNARTSEYASDDARALQFAEAGLNHARSTLWASVDASDPSAVGNGNFVLEGAAITFSGTLSGTVWTLTGTATLPNPTGAVGSIIQTVTSQVEVVAALDSDGTAWAHFFGDCDQNLTWSSSGKKITGGTACGDTTLSPSGKKTYPGGCTVPTPSGKKNIGQGWTIWARDSGSIDSPLFSRSNLCLDGSANVADAPVQVHDGIFTEGSASVGASGSPVSDTHVGVGCGLFPLPLSLPCNAADQVFSTLVDSSPLAIVKPPVDLDLWYANASPGPLNNCITGSVPGGFDNNAALRDTSLPTFDLTPGVAYSCETASGKLSYNPGSPGTLAIEGTIFFDGDIVATNSATYTGRGTIYTNGTILIQGSTELCGTAACDGTWDSEADLLVLVSGEPEPVPIDHIQLSKSGKVKSSWTNLPPLYAIELLDSARFQGALYAVADVRLDGSSELWGSAIFRLGLVQGSAQAIHMDIGTLLPGMPLPETGVGAAGTTIILNNVEGSFSGG